MRKNAMFTKQTRQNQIDSFWSLYCEKRIEKITVKDVAERAGYNRSTFYEYFTDVYHLLDDLEESIIPKLHQLPSMNSNMSIDPMNQFMELYENHLNYYAVLLSDNGDPRFSAKLKDTIKPMLRSRLLPSGKWNEMELEYILEYNLSAMIGVMNFWFRQENKPTVEALHDLIYKISTQGVTTILQQR